MKKKLSLVLIALLCLGMLTACNQGFYCNYCGFDELISGEENRMVIGSVDIDLCDKHKSEFLEGTESISVDDLLGRLDTNEAVKVRSVGGDTDIIKTEDGYKVGDTIIDSREELKEFLKNYYYGNSGKILSVTD